MDKERLHILVKFWKYVLIITLILFALLTIASLGHGPLIRKTILTFEENSVSINPPIPCLIVKNGGMYLPYHALEFDGCYDEVKINGKIIEYKIPELTYENDEIKTTINDMAFVSQNHVLILPVEYNSQNSEIDINIVVSNDYFYWVLFFTPAIFLSVVTFVAYILRKPKK